MGFAEDKWACQKMQELLDNDKIEFAELGSNGDRVGQLFRRLLLKWVLEEYQD